MLISQLGGQSLAKHSMACLGATTVVRVYHGHFQLLRAGFLPKEAAAVQPWVSVRQDATGFALILKNQMRSDIHWSRYRVQL